MLSRNEKYILRIIFQNKILKADGQAFEDIFTSIMNYKNPNFRSIKPWGIIGDRKNDGYILDEGIFYQVYAPENITNNYPEVISKLQRDFSGLKQHWGNLINEFYFVVNDKYKGVNADSEQSLNTIITDNNLQAGGFKTAKDLENILFTLEDDEITIITGSIPDPATIKTLDYSVLNDVIDYIMKISLPRGKKPIINLPDWEEKIIFNNLSEVTTHYLNNGYFQIHSLENYLSNNSDFLADELRDKLNDIYITEKLNSSGDDLFWNMVDQISPRNDQTYQSVAIIIMSKYFESCDIFEEPLKGDK